MPPSLTLCEGGEYTLSLIDGATMEEEMMAKLSKIALVVGLVGAGLTYQGVITMMPLMNWVAVAVIGGVAWVITRRPSD